MPTNSEKIQEFRTYKKLSLNREVKSKRQRNRVQSQGVEIFIGGAALGRPWMKVKKADYLRQRALMLDQFKPKDLRVHKMMDYYALPLERAIYDALLKETHSGISTDVRPNHGRAQTLRSLAEVALKITQKQINSSCNLEKIWLEVVGEEFGLQSELCRVDADKGTAYCRSLSSVVGHQIKRNSSILRKLSERLGFEVKKIIFS